MTKTDLAILTGDIDAAAATIKNVSVITVGEARGHGMQIDEKTLLQVKAAAETYAGGLKVKTDHYTGFNEIVGALKNFTIDGDQLRADLFLLKTTMPRLALSRWPNSCPIPSGCRLALAANTKRRARRSWPAAPRFIPPI
jgi:hypothetical protein